MQPDKEKDNRFIVNMENLCSALVNLSSCDTSGDKNNSLASFADYKKLKDTLRRMERDGMRPIIPFWNFMNPVLPSDATVQDHSAFADCLPEIKDVDERAITLRSIHGAESDH